MIPDSKVCSKCSADRPLIEYDRHPSGLHGRNSWCKECASHLKAERYQRQVEIERARRKDWYERNREATKARIRANNERDRLLAVAVMGGACAACPETAGLEFDHVEGGGNAHRSVEQRRTYIRRIARTGEPDPRLQLLCEECHKAKTAKEQSRRMRRLERVS